MARRQEEPIEPLECVAVRDVADLDVRAGDDIMVWPNGQGEVWVIRMSRASVGELLRMVNRGEVRPRRCEETAVFAASLASLLRRVAPPELRDPDRRASF